MSDLQEQDELFSIPDAQDGSRVINDRCLLRTKSGRCMVIVSGPIYGVKLCTLHFVAAINLSRMEHGTETPAGR